MGQVWAAAGATEPVLGTCEIAGVPREVRCSRGVCSDNSKTEGTRGVGMENCPQGTPSLPQHHPSMSVGAESKGHARGDWNGGASPMGTRDLHVWVGGRDSRAHPPVTGWCQIIIRG